MQASSRPLATMAARAFLSSRLAGQLAAVGNCGRRRPYAAAAAAAMALQEPAGGGTARVLAAAAEAPRKEEFFWMRDPKTGCWMPENHFDDVDAADLRARLLFFKKDW